MKKLSRDEVLNLIRNTVRAVEPDAQIILYGSRARGDARCDSDWIVDILLNKPGNVGNYCQPNQRAKTTPSLSLYE